VLVNAFGDDPNPLEIGELLFTEIPVTSVQGRG
jgi:hypothetical protein